MATNNILNFTGDDLISFYLPLKDDLFDDYLFRKQILEYKSLHKFYGILDEKQQFERILFHYLEEAVLTLSLLASVQADKKASFLEVGSGMGFLYGFLTKHGIKISGIEPSGLGYEGYYPAAKRLFQIVNISDSQFFPFSAQECEKLGRTYDVIVSNNVFEHIIELEAAVRGLKNALNPDGIMIHNTVNYNVPYEPHFKIPLIPFSPKSTVWIFPWLKKSDLWKGLHFVTTGELEKISKRNNLKINFRRDTLEKTLNRLEYDKEFSDRQKVFKGIYKMLKTFKLLQFIKFLPITLTTPIVFTLRHAD